MEIITRKKQGYYLVFGAIVVGLIFELIPHIITSQAILNPLGAVFNLVVMGLLAFYIIKDEFIDWFKHFSFKWLFIGIPLQLLIGIAFSLLWGQLGNSHAANTIDSLLTWQYVLFFTPLIILGEEVLSISLLYGLNRKLKIPFWIASSICAFLFAAWHLSSYGYNLLQCIITLMPTRLVLNYLFKKSDSIWISFIAHFTFDFLIFLPILLGH